MNAPTAIVLILVATIIGCAEAPPSVSSNKPIHEMTSTFQLPRGIKVANLSGVREAYSVRPTQDGYTVFTLNVSAENILNVFCSLAAEVNEPAFLLLEIGTHRDIEQELRNNDTDPLHKDVYYLDGQKWPDVKSIVDSYAELFTHDGEINFGFGSHESHDEVFVGPYKVFSIYTNDPSKYEAVLTELKFTKVDRVKTVWDNFTQDSPGQRRVITDGPLTIWEMIDELKQKGLYLAERREI